MPEPASGRLQARVAVLRHDMYRLLFIASLGSGLGTWMATIALTVDIKDRTDSTWWVSGIFLVTFMPAIVIGLAAGPLVDRLSRKRLIVSADLVRLVVFAVLPFLHSAAALLVFATISGVANSFFRPAVLAGVPNLVAEQELASGTSLLQATDWLAASVGPVLGGAIVSVSGPHLVYWINAATFLYSAVLLARIPSGRLQSEQGITRGHWRDLRDGLAAFRGSAALRTVLFGFGLTMLATGLVNVSEIFLATRTLHSNAFGYGLLWTGTGVGLVTGSVLVSGLLERRSPLAIYPWMFVPWGIGILAAALAPNIWVAAVAMVISGIGNGVTFPITVVIVQQYVPDRLRGRSFTVIISVHNALLGCAMVAAGALVGSAGARWTYGLASVLTMLGGAVAYALSRGADAQPA
jgi:MFS family permease